MDDVELKKNIDLTGKVICAMVCVGWEHDLYELSQDWYRETSYEISKMSAAEYLAKYKMEEIKRYAKMEKIKTFIDPKIED